MSGVLFQPPFSSHVYPHTHPLPAPSSQPSSPHVQAIQHRQRQWQRQWQHELWRCVCALGGGCSVLVCHAKKGETASGGKWGSQWQVTNQTRRVTCNSRGRRLRARRARQECSPSGLQAFYFRCSIQTQSRVRARARGQPCHRSLCLTSLLPRHPPRAPVSRRQWPEQRFLQLWRRQRREQRKWQQRSLTSRHSTRAPGGVAGWRGRGGASLRPYAVPVMMQAGGLQRGHDAATRMVPRSIMLL